MRFFRFFPFYILAMTLVSSSGLLILFITRVPRIPETDSFTLPIEPNPRESEPGEAFTDVVKAFQKWDSQIGCSEFRGKHSNIDDDNESLQRDVVGEIRCEELKMKHVNVLVKGWTWIPDEMENLHQCRCGLTCLWTKSSLLADNPDAHLFENVDPPHQRKIGEPLRVLLDLEAKRHRSGYEDIFISYHAKDDVQATYAGAVFRMNRNYHLATTKNNETLVYWSSSRCLPQRDELAKKILSLLPHHSFGKCLNNVGGSDTAVFMYPDCVMDGKNGEQNWWDHLHCAMSHYKFVLAIENTMTESYVTEKLFYALDSGSVPIYFGAPNVQDFVPPHSIIEGSKFSSMEELASYVTSVGNDPIAYAEYHAWRRCGVVGNYGMARAASLDTLPCRLCEAVGRRNGRHAMDN